MAVESSCEAAILVLENEKSICLVDLNYNHRLQGELYIVEAEEAMQFASMMASKVLAEWQAMADEMHTCEEYCQKTAMDYSEEEQANIVRKTKCEYAVDGLRNTCLADLHLAKYQLKNGDVWIK